MMLTASELAASANVVPDRRQLTHDLGVGFDTIALTGPSDIANLNELNKIWQTRSVDYASGEIRDSLSGGVGWLDAGQARARVGVSAKSGTMRLEVSAPHMLAGNNWDGVPVGRLDEAVGFLLDAVAASLPSVPDLRDVTVTRLDLTRDFLGVRNPSATLAQIALHAVPRATVDKRYHRQSDHGLQTLFRGNSHYWITRGYDKVHEIQESLRAEGRDPLVAIHRPSQLRFELELKSKGLRSRQLTTVQQLMEADLAQIAKEHFEKCKFHVNTGATSFEEIEAILAAEGVSVAEMRSLIVYLSCQRMGIPPLLGRHTKERSRALANRYGLGPESLGVVNFTRRLDFDLGAELVD